MKLIYVLCPGLLKIRGIKSSNETGETKMASEIGRKLRLLLYPSIFLLCISCKKILEVEQPNNTVTREEVFKDDLTAVSAMTGVYYTMMFGTSFANGAATSVVAYTGMSSDEFLYRFGSRQDLTMTQFDENQLLADNSKILGLWQSLYKIIYECNSIIEGVSESQTLSQPIKNQLKGEALFLRAFCHYYATNLFGSVPIVLTTNYNDNSVVDRKIQELVLKQVKNDLLEAKSLMLENYVRSINLSTPDRVRPNKFCASALLARVHLQLGEWSEAETEATFVLSNTSLYDLNLDLNKVFLGATSSNANKEVIWQLMPLPGSFNTQEGRYFIISNANSYWFRLTDNLVNSFQIGDQRKNAWVKFTTGATPIPFAFKYKVPSGTAITEYSMVLRVAEMYLTRAEARAQLNKFGDASQDLNIIRTRASLPSIFLTTKEDMLNAIIQEKRVEFFAEWGHRWFDLKRWNLITTVLQPLKANWSSTDVLYPVPQAELDKNRQMLPQNPGY